MALIKHIIACLTPKGHQWMANRMPFLAYRDPVEKSQSTPPQASPCIKQKQQIRRKNQQQEIYHVPPRTTCRTARVAPYPQPLNPRRGVRSKINFRGSRESLHTATRCTVYIRSRTASLWTRLALPWFPRMYACRLDSWSYLRRWGEIVH